VFFIIPWFGSIFVDRSLRLSFLDIIEELKEGAEKVVFASENIAKTGSKLSDSSVQEASALQQTAASINEISVMVTKNAENAKKSEDLSVASHTEAENGKQAVHEMIRSIEEINQSNSDIARQIELSNQGMSEIVKVIQEIGERTKVINDIVFQTKLLSFNASVEAARAGEQGKGFSVVAEEIGNLAQMSGKSAMDISQIVEKGIQRTEEIVEQTRSKVGQLISLDKAKVESGVVTAKRCSEFLEKMVTNVAQLKEMVTEISTASDEQSRGVQEITKALGQLDQVAAQNSAVSEESAKAAVALSVEANRLQSIIVNSTHKMIEGSLVRHQKSHGAKSNEVKSHEKSHEKSNDTKSYEAKSRQLQANSTKTSQAKVSQGKSHQTKTVHHEGKTPEKDQKFSMSKQDKAGKTPQGTPALSSQSGGAQVIPFPEQKRGIGANVPSENDPRFKDI
jgi:methyl-accepting chemotaxis protein